MCISRIRSVHYTGEIQEKGTVIKALWHTPTGTHELSLQHLQFTTGTSFHHIVKHFSGGIYAVIPYLLHEVL